MKYFCSSLILLLLFSFSGCGDSQNLIEITGMVTIKGELIDKGIIQFVPVNGVGQEGGGTIHEGKFTAKVPPGEKIVRVDGSKVTGTKEVSPMPGTTIKTDIEKPLTSRKKHWDNSTVRITVNPKNEPFQIELP
jgi:hypothetical protein